VTPDTYMPAGAVYVQRSLGALKAAAFDVSAACTGVIYGLTVASSLVRCGICKPVRVVGAETLSRVVDFTDRNTCILFGDGAGAAIVSRAEAGSPPPSVERLVAARGARAHPVA